MKYKNLKYRNAENTETAENTINAERKTVDFKQYENKLHQKCEIKDRLKNIKVLNTKSWTGQLKLIVWCKHSRSIQYKRAPSDFVSSGF